MVEKAVIIGGSAGSLNALLKIIEQCPKDLKAPFVVVVHRGRNQNNLLLELIKQRSKRPVVEAEHYAQLENGKVFLAPNNYHLLLGTDHHLELDFSEKVLHSRPSIDVSFFSFANILKDKLIGIVLSGANKDSAEGATSIIQNGGTVIVQNPLEADVSIMPEETLNANPEIQDVVESTQIMRTILKLINQ